MYSNISFDESIEDDEDSVSENDKNNSDTFNAKSGYNDYSVTFISSPDTMHSGNITSLQYTQTSFPLQINKSKHISDTTKKFTSVSATLVKA